MAASMTSTPRQPTVRRYPVRGALWGLLLGLSLALWAVLTAMVTFGNWVAFALIVVAGIAIGVAWSYVAPPKGANAAPPTPRTTEAVAPDPEPVRPAGDTASSGAAETIHVDADDAGGSFSSKL